MRPPSEVLQVGREILDPVFDPHGFRFEPGEFGTGSGGPFASGSYVRAGRRLEVHVRHSLGLVTYHVGALALPHEDLMRALVPPGERAAYPGFSNDPLDGFRHLRADLDRFGQPFLAGVEEELRAVAARAVQLRRARPRGFRAISKPPAG